MSKCGIAARGCAERWCGPMRKPSRTPGAAAQKSSSGCNCSEILFRIAKAFGMDASLYRTLVRHCQAPWKRWTKAPAAAQAAFWGGSPASPRTGFGSDRIRPASTGRGNRDRKSVVTGKSVTVRVDVGGRRIIKNKIKQSKEYV